MKLKTAFAAGASAALGLAMMASAPAAAGDPQACQAQAEIDCALFVPVGSANWAHCVETLTEFCILYTAAPVLDPSELLKAKGEDLL